MRKMIFTLFFISIFTARVYAQSFFVETIETEMFVLLNEIREERALPPLTQNWEVTRVAMYKAEEMKNLNYSAHNSPVHGNPADMLNRYEIPFAVVGENIAAGPFGLRETAEVWLNTPVFRDNILNPGFKEVGIGRSRSSITGNSYWVLLFIM